MKCMLCKRHPSEIDEYRELKEVEECADEEEAVRQNDGTYNAQEDIFACTDCYDSLGMPAGMVDGHGWWRAHSLTDEEIAAINDGLESYDDVMLKRELDKKETSIE